MKEFKHTPGPWSILYRVGCDMDIHSERYGRVCKFEGLSHSIEAMDEYEDEERANAKLIAAAPELLEACINALDTLKSLSGGINDSTQESLREAIKKATE